MTNEEITAYHEAGHAVAALVLSAGNVRASVERDDQDRSWGRVNYIFSKTAPVSRAMIVYAGPAAAWRVMEGCHRDKDNIEGNEAEELLDLIHDIEPDPAELHPTLVAVGRMSEQLLDDHWASVEKVAEALLRSTSLNAAELLSLHTEH